MPSIRYTSAKKIIRRLMSARSREPELGKAEAIGISLIEARYFDFGVESSNLSARIFQRSEFANTSSGLVSWFRSSLYCRYRVVSELRNQNDTRNKELLVSLRFRNSRKADIEMGRILESGH